MHGNHHKNTCCPLHFQKAGFKSFFEILYLNYARKKSTEASLKDLAGLESFPFSRLFHLEFLDHSNQIIFKIITLLNSKILQMKPVHLFQQFGH